MNNILISIICNDQNNKTFAHLYDRFQKNGYTIEHFEFSSKELSLELLTVILDYVKSQERYSQGINRLVILSNMQDLLLSWYRLYNSIVDDFILTKNFINVARIMKEPESLIIQELASFSNITEEPVEGKIFLDIDDSNYKNIMAFLLETHIAYFEDLLNFDFNQRIEKHRYGKIYSINEYEVESVYIAGGEKIRIKIENKPKGMVTIDEAYLKSIIHFPWFLFYFSRFILDSQFGINEKQIVLQGLIGKIPNNQQQNDIVEFMIDQIMQIDSFKEKINYLSMMVKLQTIHNVLPYIFKVLKEDNNYLSYHFAVLTNTLFYLTHDKQKTYPDLFKDRIEVMRNIKKYYKRQLRFGYKEKNGAIKKIAIIAGQLLSKNHAPTLWCINYANNIKKYLPDYDVKIFVDDIFNYSYNELFWTHAYKSEDSREYYQEIKKDLHSKISLYYSDSNLNRFERLQSDIQAIHNFQPDVIFKIGSPYSLATDQLYEKFPVVSMTIGGAEDSPFVDIYTGGYDVQSVDKLYKEQGITERNYMKHSVGIEKELETIEKSRPVYGLEEHDFVFVSVGNRLRVEMSEDFIETVCSFLYSFSNSKWLIVGGNNHEYISENYNDLILTKKIIFVPYEKNLFSLYRICDVYINPYRKGGGNSGAMAMKAGLPVVSIKGTYDVSEFVGQENCVNKSVYKDEMIKLYKDPNYLKEKQERMVKRIKEEYSFFNTVKELRKIFELSIKQFDQRKSKQ